MRTRSYNEKCIKFVSCFQTKLRWNTDDGGLIHQGYLWKKVSKTVENRYWALLFTDVFLLSNVSSPSR